MIDDPKLVNIKIDCKEDYEITLLIKHLLCSRLVQYSNMIGTVSIQYYITPEKLQKYIYDWLSVPERKQNFEGVK